MDLTISKSQSSPRRTTLIYLGLAILIGSVVGVAITGLTNPFFLLLAVGGMAVVIVTIISTEFGLLLFIFVTYTRFSDIGVHLYNGPSVAKYFVGLLLVVIIIRWVLRGEQPNNWQVPALLLGLYGFVGFLSLDYAEHVDSVVTTLNDYVKDALIALIILVLLKGGPTFRRVMWTLLLVGLFLGGLSVFQYFTGTFTEKYGGFAMAEFHNIAGGESGYRLTGPIGDANFFAQIMVVLVPIGFERMLHERKPFLRLLAALTGVLSTMTVIFTYSRGAFLAAAVAITILFFMNRPSPLQAIVVIALGLGMFALTPPAYFDRIQTLSDLLPNRVGGINVRNDVSIQGRASQYLTGIEMFRQRPLLGVGLNNFSYLYPQYSKEIGLAPDATNRSLHNLYLEVATETGAVGLSVFLALIWYAFRCAARARKIFLEVFATDYANLATALVMGFISYLVSALFIHAAFPRYFYLLLGIMYALPAVAEQVKLAVGVSRAGLSLDNDRNQFVS